MGTRLLRMLMGLGVCVLFMTGTAMALPYSDTLPYSWAPLADGDDAYWSLEGDYEVQILSEYASYAPRNSFGLYYGENWAQVFSGEMSVETPAMTINMTDMADQVGSSTFGFYLDSPDGVFYSDTVANQDKTDHLLAWLGNDGDIYLAFEDLYAGGDFDYDDLVIALRKIMPAPAPVPEPGTLLLLGSGLLGLASCRKKRKA